MQEETVGPSLGAASIEAGFTACVVAFVLLMVFMCVFYGVIPGMVANVALLLNFFFMFGVLVSFQAALTMSGIAGMVLSLGMAVDANVLIYERTKEELRAGKNLKAALADGYGNAFSAIFDSNLTSIITAIILYNFGTGRIRRSCHDARYRYLCFVLYRSMDYPYGLRTLPQQGQVAQPYFRYRHQPQLPGQHEGQLHGQGRGFCNHLLDWCCGFNRFPLYPRTF